MVTVDDVCVGSSLLPVQNGIVPLCFLDLIGFGLNSLFLFILGSIRLRSLFKTQNQDMSMVSKLHRTKIIICAIAAVLPLFRSFFKIFTKNGIIFQVVSDAYISIAWMVAIFLVIFEFSRAQRNNWIIRTWWVTTFILASFNLQTEISFAKQRGKLYSVDMIYSSLFFAASFIMAVIGLFYNRIPEAYERLAEASAPDTAALSVDDPELASSDSILREISRKGDPEMRANFFSKLGFSWLNPLLLLGYKRPLEMSDLHEIPSKYHSQQVAEAFGRIWDEEKQKAKPSIIRTFHRAFGGPFYLSGILKLLQDAMMFAGPILLQRLIAFVGDSSLPTWQGFVYVALLFGSSVLQSIALHQYFHSNFKTGMQSRSALVSAIYKKSFYLSNKARQQKTLGEIVNLQAIDANRMADLFPYLHTVWSAPEQIIVSIIMLWRLVGPSALAGFGVMVLTAPLNAVLARKLSAVQKQIMALRDRRIKTMNEALAGIRVIKFFAWEKSFTGKISDIRNQELQILKKTLLLRAFSVLLWATTPVFVALTTFVIFAVSGGELTAERAFTALAIFNILRFPLNMLPMIFSQLVEARVSLRRIQDFLLAEELDPSAVERHSESATGTAVEIREGTFKWDEKLENPTLQDINVRIPQGKLVAIVGAVGAGKSSFLSAILGDIPKLNGHVNVIGSVAYAAQQPWVQNATLRDNITFGRQFDPDRYDEVLKVCELNQDISILPDGDQTEIGEKGINLSGGQKQRVSLARAVYQDLDLYLLDDCLSAVDAHVGRNIFNNCIKGILKNKTRILVTHQLQFVSNCDLIIVLKGGAIAEMGNYEQLMANNQEFATLIKTHVNSREGEGMETSTTPEEKKEKKDSKKTEEGAAKGKLISAEDREVGQVTWKVWKSYLASLGGLCITFFILTTYVDETGSRMGSDFWLSFWSSNQGGRLAFYLGVYAALSLATGFIVFIRALVINIAGIRSSKLLHEQMLEKVLRAPMSYFDTTPIGRILNRFSKDINTIDESLTRSLSQFVSMIFSALSVMVAIGIVTPFFLTSLLPLAFLYRYIQKYYLQSSRELKRLDSISKSPIYAQFSETLSGLTTIRPFRREIDFIDRNNEKMDVNNRAYYSLVSSNRWLGMRVEFIGTSVVTLAAAFAVVERSGLGPGFAGLSISYALQLTGILNWLVRMATEAETQMVSVERVMNYTELRSEAPAVVLENRPPNDWPAKGTIDFKDVQLRYREGLDLVLRGVSFNIKSREKIGVVGRTGAGKSSLMLALFRLVELAGGKILIDGIDIAKIGLEDLRSKLSIIPQDPTLFTGTIRSNLDPFHKHTDLEIWEALVNCHLRSAVEALPDKLESKVSEFGENFSVGQRQLMCLGRALLCKAKILIMDEATAAVDFETDALIQNTIREQFKDVTVLTIAHRINTILDYDKILVLDRGRVAEFDSPAILSKDPNTIFFALLNKSGRRSEEISQEDILVGSPSPSRFEQ